MNTKQELLTIITNTAESYGVSIDDLIGHRRSGLIAEARGLAMALCYELTRASYQEVAGIFGKSCHSTVVHAVKSYRKRKKAESVERHIVEKMVSASVGASGRNLNHI